MKVKVRNYMLRCNYYDSIKGVFYTKVDTSEDNQIHIYFDENIYFDNTSSFKKELEIYISKYYNKQINEIILCDLELGLNLLLEKYKNMKLLFSKKDLFSKSYEDMDFLEKEELFDEY